MALIRKLLSNGKYLEVEEIILFTSTSRHQYSYTRLSDWKTACVRNRVNFEDIDNLLDNTSHGHFESPEGIEWTKKYHLPKAT